MSETGSPLSDAPRFTARATARHESHGRTFFRGASASSSISEADARQAARRLAEARAVAAANSRRLLPANGAYPYPERVLVEPILERIVMPTGGADEEVAKITRNNYGASVLNAYGIMFVDVDTAADSSNAPGQKPVDHREAIAALVGLCGRRPELAFRVYTTRAGLRYVCLSRTFDPISRESEDILRELQSDPRYATLCRIQKCYRARLSPKPWRCVDRSRPPGFFARLLRGPHTVRRDHMEFAVCRFVERIGAGGTLPAAERVVALHDRETAVSSNRPLA
jgi:hypothetical protein